MEQLWSNDRLTLYGVGLLFLTFVAGCLLAVAAAIYSPAVLYALPVLICGGVAGFFVVTNRRWNLYLVIIGFILIAEFQAGLQIQEVVYGLWMLAFLGYWYFDHLLIQKRRLIVNSADRVVALFCIYACLSAGWSFLNGAAVGAIASEALVFLMLGFYYPVKHAISSRSSAARDLIASIAILGFLVFARNVLEYQSALASAEQLYQIASGRASSNEALQLFPAIGAMVAVLFASDRKWVLLACGAFLLFFGGLIITQSRGYWVSFAIAAAALFLLVDRSRKIRIVGLASLGMSIGTLVAYLLFPDIASYIIGGLLERAASLGSAFTSDISLVNRFYESKSVWSYIMANPILGYGMGSSYSYYNIIYDATRTWTFIHNGYLGLWFKYGAVGLTAVLTLWITAVVNGIRVFRKNSISTTSVLALAASLCLIAQAVVANTSNPFLIEDTVLMFAVMIAIVSGAVDRLGGSQNSGLE